MEVIISVNSLVKIVHISTDVPVFDNSILRAIKKSAKISLKKKNKGRVSIMDTLFIIFVS